MRRGLALAAVLVLVGAVAGCSGPGAESEPTPVTPEGWQRVEDGALSFAVPGDWVEVPESNDPWTLGWSDAADLEEATVLVVGAPAFGDDGAEAAVSTFMAGTVVSGWGYSSEGRSVPVETETLEVHRNDFTYDGLAGVFWAAADPRTGRTVALQLTAGDLPDDVLDGIEQSIVVRSGTGA